MWREEVTMVQELLPCRNLYSEKPFKYAKVNASCSPHVIFKILYFIVLFEGRIDNPSQYLFHYHCLSKNLRCLQSYFVTVKMGLGGNYTLLIAGYDIIH